MENEMDWSDKFKTIEAYLEYKKIEYNKMDKIIDNQDGEIYGNNKDKGDNFTRE